MGLIERRYLPRPDDTPVQPHTSSKDTVREERPTSLLIASNLNGRLLIFLSLSLELLLDFELLDHALDLNLLLLELLGRHKLRRRGGMSVATLNKIASGGRGSNLLLLANSLSAGLDLVGRFAHQRLRRVANVHLSRSGALGRRRSRRRACNGASVGHLVEFAPVCREIHGVQAAVVAGLAGCP